MLVSSRVFGIVVEQVKTDALVPMADMLNHRLPKQTSWYYSDLLGGFVVESLREIAQGAEVFDSYGQKCNSRFLLSYGFV
jgi:protein-histidine N-methyltransferase